MISERERRHSPNCCQALALLILKGAITRAETKARPKKPQRSHATLRSYVLKWLASPGRLELPTPCLGGRCSVQTELRGRSSECTPDDLQLPTDNFQAVQITPDSSSALDGINVKD